MKRPKDIYILGISAFYHDSAATILKNGEIIAAAQEERFTRKKHDYHFPKNSIDYCLREAGVDIKDINYVAFYDKPFIKFERILHTYLTYAPVGLCSFMKAMPLWLKQKIFLRDYIAQELKYKGKILFSEHHISHAASAFYPSPFKEAAVLTLDGVGEWTTTSLGIGKGNDIQLHTELKFPHSLGLLYSAFTYYIGFRVNSGEYKVMGLAPYGEPKYVDLILNNLVDLKEDGSFKLNMKYFNYCAGLTMTNHKFHQLFGGEPRKPDTKIEQRHMDLAASIQKVTEEIILRMVKHIFNITRQKNLCLAGGVALNCVANGKILREGPFKRIWIQPAATDAGGALGAALVVWHKYLNKERNINEVKDSQKASYLGPQFSKEQIREFLDSKKIPYEELRYEDIPNRAAQLINDQKVLGWFQGRMEFGPRALGSRSILGDPRSPEMQSIINLKIKFRESFRPFAPTVLEDRVGEYFDIVCSSPYMLLTAPVREEKRLPVKEEGLFGLDKLKVKRSVVPAITHVDYSARVQTVNKDDNPLYYNTINAFYNITGCPIVINTSFNVRGEPIVCTPEDAFNCFMRTEMDYLIMDRFLLDKKKQDSLMKEQIPKAHFEPD